MTNRERLKEIVSKTNLNHSEIANLIILPARHMSKHTIREYLQGRRQVPDYVVEQLTYKLGA